MECVFGFVGDGFAVIPADSSAVQSILVYKSDEEKIMVLDSHKLLGASGEAGDRSRFTEYIQKNVHLSQIRNGVPLSTAAVANFVRHELAAALRKGGSFKGPQPMPGEFSSFSVPEFDLHLFFATQAPSIHCRDDETVFFM